MKAQPRFKDSAHFKAYWENGNGRELLDWSGEKVDISHFEKYAHLYHQVDELADAAVQDTYMQMPYPQASAVIEKFTKNPVSEDDDAPQSVKNLFLQMQQVPDWFDARLANKGAELCMRSGANSLVILRDFVLMGGYDYAYLTKPLIFTGALKKGAVKRLKDTLDFWIQVTRENALQPFSEAYRLIARTRLMHSYSRLSIKNKIKEWNTELWGEPINSWDMIATYTGFSLIYLQGLRKLKVQFSGEEEAGVYHLWKYVGYLLGIPHEYLPENRQQAVKQLYLWSALQDKSDADSVQLAQALLQENLENTIYPYKVQRRLLLKLHQSMSWFLLDREINERLQIPSVSVESVFPKLITGANRVANSYFAQGQPKKIRKHVALGNKIQMDVLRDYIKHTPKDFHY